MPIINIQGKEISCQVGANLREVMLQSSSLLYNGQAKLINCRGLGTCGTCAVEIEGETSPVNWKDKLRRSLPPHTVSRNLRLACQTKILGDIKVSKYNGFWGQGAEKIC